RKNSTIQIKHIEANYDRGVTADILGIGGINDYGKFLPVAGDTKIVVKKDSKIIAEIPVKVQDLQKIKYGFQPPQLVEKPRLLWFVVKVGKDEKIVHPDEQISVFEGDDFEIVNAVYYPNVKREDMLVNFVGYYGGTRYGVEDDIGIRFQVNGNLLERFALEKDLYHAYAKYRDEKTGSFRVKIVRPKIKYFIFREGSGEKKCYLNGEKMSIGTEGRKVSIFDIVADVDAKNIDVESPCGTYKFADVQGKDLAKLMLCEGYSNKKGPHYLRARKGHMVLGSLDIIIH
ncbi:MAG: hypothetical protein JXA66_04770, partial [Oligoflexia bacterium]|nr:hypothetical protein [Oligoflexia bacterium]